MHNALTFQAVKNLKLHYLVHVLTNLSSIKINNTSRSLNHSSFNLMVMTLSEALKMYKYYKKKQLNQVQNVSV